jgi:hypothetical protein
MGWPPPSAAKRGRSRQDREWLEDKTYGSAYRVKERIPYYFALFGLTSLNAGYVRPIAHNDKINRIVGVYQTFK